MANEGCLQRCPRPNDSCSLRVKGATLGFCLSRELKPIPLPPGVEGTHQALSVFSRLQRGLLDWGSCQEQQQAVLEWEGAGLQRAGKNACCSAAWEDRPGGRLTMPCAQGEKEWGERSVQRAERV